MSVTQPLSRGAAKLFLKLETLLLQVCAHQLILPAAHLGRSVSNPVTPWRPLVAWLVLGSGGSIHSGQNGLHKTGFYTYFQTCKICKRVLNVTRHLPVGPRLEVLVLSRRPSNSFCHSLTPPREPPTLRTRSPSQQKPTWFAMGRRGVEARALGALDHPAPREVF